MSFRVSGASLWAWRPRGYKPLRPLVALGGTSEVATVQPFLTYEIAEFRGGGWHCCLSDGLSAEAPPSLPQGSGPQGHLLQPPSCQAGRQSSGRRSLPRDMQTDGHEPRPRIQLLTESLPPPQPEAAAMFEPELGPSGQLPTSGADASLEVMKCKKVTLSRPPPPHCPPQARFRGGLG